VELRLAGYFPKRVVARPEWLAAPHVKDVSSMSLCISPGPDDWMALEQHNSLFLFDTPEQAFRAAPGSGWRVFAYRLLTACFRDGNSVLSALMQRCGAAVDRELPLSLRRSRRGRCRGREILNRWC
jgi:hypothetical protein